MPEYILREKAKKEKLKAKTERKAVKFEVKLRSGKK